MASSGSLNTNKYSTSSSGTVGLNLTWYVTSQSVETNSTTIRWELKTNGTMSRNMAVTGGPITVVIGGITVLNQTGRFRVYGGGRYYQASSVTIPHDNDGTKLIDISVRAALYNSQVNCTASASDIELDRIPRYATITSAPNFTDEINPVLGYQNLAGEIVDSLQAGISLDGGTTMHVAYRDISKLGESYTFELTTAERNTLLQAVTTANSATATFVVKTVLGGVTYTDSLASVFSIINADPTITSTNYADTNPATVAITGDNQQIIQNESNLYFTFTGVEVKKYATVVSLTVSFNNVTKTATISGTAATLDFGPVNVSSNLDATITLTDSRGNKYTGTKTITVFSYEAPTAIVSAVRTSNYYPETTISADADYASLGGQNHVTITWYYKELTASTYITGGTIPDGGSTTVNLDNKKTWNVKFDIADTITTTTYVLVVEMGIPIIFFDRALRSVSVNKFPESGYDFDVEGNVNIDGYMKLGYKHLMVIGSMEASSHTVPDLVDEVRMTSGCMGSVEITTAYTASNGVVAVGWYNFLWIPHRTGGLNGEDDDDNCDNGHLFLYGMDVDGEWTLRYENSTIVYCYMLFNNGDTIPVSNGGTGATTASDARTSLGFGYDEVVDTAFDSGYKTFNDVGYTSLNIVGRVTSGGSYHTRSIPVAFLTSTDQRFCLADEANYITFLIKLDNGVFTITFNTKSSSGIIDRVYGVI